MRRWLPPLALAACGHIDIGPTHFEYVASVADCIDPLAPDLTACQARKGPSQLVSDRNDTATLTPWYAYVRFDFDSQLAGAKLASVVLRAAATDSADAPSNMSGEIWQVSEFTETDLATTVPTKLARLAPDQGAVVNRQIVEWQLPAMSIAAGTPLCLGILPTTDDGVHYWNLLGADPPRLIVDTR
jgi:hypothetical protein